MPKIKLKSLDNLFDIIESHTFFDLSNTQIYYCTVTRIYFKVMPKI